MAYYYYGLRALIVIGISVAVSVITEYICCLAMKKKYDWLDFSSINSGILIALLMPASVPYRIIVFTSAFMASVCKQAFGGRTNLIFNPVAVAYIFSALAWPLYVLRYPAPQPFGSLPLQSEITDVLGRSFTYLIDSSQSAANYLDILCGRLAGSMGGYAVLIIAVCMIALICMKNLPLSVIIPAVGVNFALHILYPLTYNGHEAALYSLVTGSFMFVLTFMACEPELTPKSTIARVLYGSLFSVLTFVLRRVCGLENSAVYALVIVEIFVLELDKYAAIVESRFRRFGGFMGGKLKKLVIFYKFKSSDEKEVTSNEQ